MNNLILMKKTLNLIKRDPWLSPYKDTIVNRAEYAKSKEKELTSVAGSLSDFATGYLYYGLHKVPSGWTFREWAPNATKIYLIGDFNNWQEDEKYSLQPLENGSWEINLPFDAIKHQDLYKLSIHWKGGKGERIPAWSTRVVQDPENYVFSAQVWNPDET